MKVFGIWLIAVVVAPAQDSLITMRRIVRSAPGRIPAALVVKADGTVLIAGRKWGPGLELAALTGLRRSILHDQKFFSIDGDALGKTLARKRVGRPVPNYAWDGAITSITVSDEGRSHTVELRSPRLLAPWFEDVPELQRLATVKAELDFVRNLMIAGGLAKVGDALTRANAALAGHFPYTKPFTLHDLRLATPRHGAMREFTFHRAAGPRPADTYAMVAIDIDQKLDPAIWVEGSTSDHRKSADAVVAATEKVIRSDAWSKGHPGRTDAAIAGVRRLSTTALETSFPNHEFWIVETVDRNDRDQDRWARDHTFGLAIVDEKARKTTYYGRRGFDAERFWRLHGPRPESLEQAVAAEELLHDLGRIGGGTATPGAGMRDAITLDHFLRKLHLLGTERTRMRGPSRVVDGKASWHVIRWRLRADDWDMPVSLGFRVVSFRKSDGALRLWNERHPTTFPSSTRGNEPAIEAAIEGFCEKVAKTR